MLKVCSSSTVLLLVLALGSIASGQQQERVCATARYTAECEQLQRGVSDVICVQVQDSVECAQRIRNGTADFGVFSAESVLLTASLGWDGLTVVKELRNAERVREPVDFQAAVVVRSNHTGGINGLRGLRYCHPGFFYSRTQRWTEGVLKHFERLVTPTQCEDFHTVTEIEAAGLSRFFGESCRPGLWSQIPKEDADLKEKYSNLCTLCPNSTTCSYDGYSTPHQSALQCLEHSADVVYASTQDIQRFFNDRSSIANDFAFLCPNGTIQPVTGTPCSWLRQPWPTVMASTTKAIQISTRIDQWVRSTQTAPSLWEEAIVRILTRDDQEKIVAVGDIQLPADYIRPFRPIPVVSDLCQTTVRWCTTSLEEKQKCDVLSRAALTTGVLPYVECNNPTTNRMTCLDNIANNRADFVGIDSNYGFLARQKDLTAAMYQETEKEKYSSVVVLVHEGKGVDRFERLRDSKACFPEFGGIASVAFVNVGRSRGIFDRNECDYSRLMSDFFSESCAPGSRDKLHDPTGENSANLCALCRYGDTPTPRQASNDEDDTDAYTEQPSDDLEQPPVEGIDEALRPKLIEVNADPALLCAASESNRYYGTRGALRCLQEAGDVAIVEAQNLAGHAQFLAMNESSYRVLCRNGSLASYTGFTVDEECYLTTIVDGEIVVRRQWEKSDNIVHMLSSLDVYLQNDPDFRMYNIFGGMRNLLFEDSALGLVSPQHAELGASVRNYIRLFENIEDCQNSAPSTTLAPGGTGGRAAIITVNLFLTILLAGIIAWRL
ncbi:transferrin-like [Anopheles ziemanni]|uniref:transferrin-like n=1 Tax=Anopheles coustani TaxID=139045 RepID=UPI00265A1F0E|nr:transferrin-like [Anopheles coustani]XP_058172451.1 transferrin-like [Anopheles ziemanni]